MLKVYLSSTKVDLQKYREAVSEILRAPLEVSVIDSYDAATGSVRDTCLQDVAKCDVYIGIIAWRYGHIPEDDNPEGKSITELEYLQAKETPGMARFLFMLDPAEPWPGDRDHDDTKNDPDAAGKKVKALRDSVVKDRAALFKAQPADLANKVLRALTRWNGPTPWTKPYLVRPERGHPIVGRSEIIEELWQLILDGRSASLHFLPGVGKTTLALELVRDRARVLTRFEGVLWADLGSKPDYTLAYQEWAKALGVPKEQCDACATDADWQSVLRSAIGEHKLLVVLDDVWQENAAQTFVDLVPEGVFILTTRARGTAFTDVHKRAVKHIVPELSASAARELLEVLAPEAVRAHSRETDTLVKAVNGIPLALLLAGKYLRKASADGDPNRLRKAFQKMLEAGERFKLAAPSSNGESQSFKEIIEESYAILPSKNAQRAFLALSIFRPKPHQFTEDMAREVCGIDDDTIYELNDMGLLEHYGGPGAYTMHRVIAQFARDKLNPADSIALHRRAVDYFDGKLKEQAGPDRGEYLYWYRYEQADWQTLMDAWLYHLSHAGDEDGAMVAFVRRYFDAFWWWGYYQRFQFSEQMIDEWSPRRLREDFREALEHLQRFADSYPAGYEKRGQGNWGKVVDAIHQLRRILKLEDGGANLSRYNGRRVRAFTEFLLAEGYAYGEADTGGSSRDKALSAYALAYDRFIDLGEPWVSAWIRFYEADARFDWGDSVGAHLRGKQALEEATHPRLAKVERDQELIANLRRLQGDIAVAAGQMEIAFASYAAASFHAWLFQAVPEDADSYTMAFYQEVTEKRIAQQLVRLASTQRAQAEGLLLRLAEFCAPTRDGGPVSAETAAELLNRGSAAEVAAVLFPAPLPVFRLRSGAADFAARVRELSPQLEAKLEALSIYQ